MDNPYAPAMQANAMAQQRQQMMAQRLAAGGVAPMPMPGPNGPPGVPGAPAMAASNPLAGLDMQGIARAFRQDPNAKPLAPGAAAGPGGPALWDRMQGFFGMGGGTGGNGAGGGGMGGG